MISIALCYVVLLLCSPTGAWNASQTPHGHGPEVLVVSGAQDGVFPTYSRDVLLGQLAAYSEFSQTITPPAVSLQVRFGGTLLESLHDAIEGGISNAAARNRSVVAVLGPETSDPSVLAAALLNHYPGISHITQLATTELLGDHNRFPSYFRMFPSTDTMARAMLLQLQRLGRSHFSFVVQNNAYGHSAKSSINRAAAELGLAPTTQTVHTRGSDDFVHIVQQLHGSAVRSIFLLLAWDEVDEFVLAAQDAGMDLRRDYTVFMALTDFENLHPASLPYLDGAITMLHLVARPSDPLVVHALSELQQARAEHPSLFPPIVAAHSVVALNVFLDAYTSTHAVLSAINATAHTGRNPTNPFHVRDQLRNTTFASFAGRQLSFGASQEVLAELQFIQRLPNSTLQVVGMQHTNGYYEAHNEPYVSPLHTTPFVAESCKLNSVRDQRTGECELCPDGTYNPSDDRKSQCVSVPTSTTLDTQTLVVTVLGAAILITIAICGGYAKQSQVKARSAEQRAKETSTYTSFVFHEVRNPLAQAAAHLEFIGGHVHELADRVSGCGMCSSATAGLVDSLRADMDVAQLGMDHTVDVLNGIRDLSDLISGDMQLTPVPTTLHELCSDLVMLISHANATTDVHLRCVGVVARGDFQCFVDARRLRQVLMNLLLNALKATATSGSVRLHVAGKRCRADSPTRAKSAKVAPQPSTREPSTSSTNEWLLVTFRVQDTGPGLGEHQLRSLFQPTMHDTVHRHTGLGLSISKKLVERMGGTLTAKSPWSEDSCGTEVAFTLRLPAAAVRTHPALPSEEHSSLPQLSTTSWDTGVVPELSKILSDHSPWTPPRSTSSGGRSLRSEEQHKRPAHDHVALQVAAEPPATPQLPALPETPAPLAFSPMQSSLVSKVLLPSKLRVLLVDDLRINRAILARKFRSGPFGELEWSIDNASTGEEALHMFQNDDRAPSYDLIVLDQILTQAGGELLGTETCERMRAIEKACQWTNALIVFCSGNVGPDDLGGFISAGGEFCWGKPTPTPLQMYEDLLSVMRRRQDAVAQGVVGTDDLHMESQD